MQLAQPVTYISPAAMWHAALSGPQRYLLLGDCWHGQPAIPNAITEAIPILRQHGVGAYANEASPKIFKPIIDTFNDASEHERAVGLDQARLKLSLSRIGYLNDGGDELKQQALRNADYNLIVAARTHTLPIYGIQFIPVLDGVDLLPEISQETKTRLKETDRYFTVHGEFPRSL